MVPCSPAVQPPFPLNIFQTCFTPPPHQKKSRQCRLQQLYTHTSEAPVRHRVQSSCRGSRGTRARNETHFSGPAQENQVIASVVPQTSGVSVSSTVASVVRFLHSGQGGPPVIPETSRCVSQGSHRHSLLPPLTHPTLYPYLTQTATTYRDTCTARRIRAGSGAGDDLGESVGFVRARWLHHGAGLDSSWRGVGRIGLDNSGRQRPGKIMRRCRLLCAMAGRPRRDTDGA